MLEALAIVLLNTAIWLRRSWIGSLLSFCGLAVAIYSLRTLPAGVWSFSFATLTVLFFWIAQNLRVTITNTRTILILTIGLGLMVFLFRDFLPFSGGQAADPWKAIRLEPGMIESLQSSHEE